MIDSAPRRMHRQTQSVGGSGGALVAAILAAVAVAVAASARAAAAGPIAAGSECAGTDGGTLRSGSRSDGVRSEEKVVLRADPQQLTWTFDANRGMIALPVVVEATPPLTGSAASDIQITPAATLMRDDRSRVFPRKATHTSPKISRHGERITFSICIDPAGAHPGRYTAAFFVDGAENVSGTTLEISVTTRSKEWFITGSLVALLAVIGVLTMKGVSDYRKELSGTGRKFRWREAVWYIWNPAEGRLLTSLVGVVTAALVAFGLYNSDRTWGDDWYTDIVALVGAAFTAVGAQGVLDGIRGTVTVPRER